MSLGHPLEKTAATEGYPPNIDLCRKTLLPLGIDFKAANGNDHLPYADESFDLVINRHGDFNAREIHRVLRPGGLFVTQQVGAENDRELVQLLCGDTPLPFPEQHLGIAEDKFRKAGFDILAADEHFGVIEFYDIGALTWFARIISWEFPHFSVDTHAENLIKAQAVLEKTGRVAGRTHRFMLVAKKSGKEGK